MEEVLIEILEKLLDASIDQLTIDKFSHESGIGERDRQLLVFSRRLALLQEVQVPSKSQMDLIKKIELFVSKLSRIGSDVPLYFWSANSKSNSWKGWCTDNDVLYFSESNT
ncbi:hypothetical protein R50072_36920 [Simiduia litorea]|uniref:hypothetical protein n=1 Tax=Simiduia litorea TaxID=1435348 RepID=UPI0036F31196